MRATRPADLSMANAFTITATLTADQRAGLEQLLYFNVNQDRVRSGIQKSIDRYGMPEIREKDGKLAIGVGRLEDVQTLFAVSKFGNPVGVAVFARVAPERIVILHLGVMPRLQSTSEVNTQVLLALIEEIFRLARAASGVEHVDFAYSYRQAASRPQAVSKAYR